MPIRLLIYLGNDIGIGAKIQFKTKLWYENLRHKTFNIGVPQIVTNASELRNYINQITEKGL